jgi:hypothetical protein
MEDALLHPARAESMFVHAVNLVCESVLSRRRRMVWVLAALISVTLFALGVWLGRLMVAFQTG